VAVSDTYITDWKADFETNDTNSPFDTVDLQTELGDEVRNLKSVYRQQAENRAWVDRGDLPDAIATADGQTVWDFPRTSNVLGAGTGRLVRITDSLLGTLIHRIVEVVDTGTVYQVTTEPCMKYQGEDVLTRVSQYVWTIAGDQTAVYEADQHLLFIDSSTGFQYVDVIDTVEFTTLTTITFTSSVNTVDPPESHYLYMPQKHPSSKDNVTRFEMCPITGTPWTSGFPRQQQGGSGEGLTTDQAVGFKDTEPNTDYEVKATVTKSRGRTGSMTTLDAVKENTLLTSAKTTSGFNLVFPVDPADNSHETDVDFIALRRQTT